MQFSMIFIQQKYKDLDGEVIRKNGIILLRELTAEVKNFMDFKMNAVLVSERLRLNYSRRLKFSNYCRVFFCPKCKSKLRSTANTESQYQNVLNMIAGAALKINFSATNYVFPLPFAASYDFRNANEYASADTMIFATLFLLLRFSIFAWVLFVFLCNPFYAIS